MKTLAHKLLDVEREFGTGMMGVSDESYNRLDVILERAKDIDTEQDPEKIFEDIAQLLEEEGLECRSRASQVFSHSLETRKIDCKISILYYSIGEVLGLPISLVLAPNHVFTRFDDGKRRFNFETIIKTVLDDQKYIDRYKIAEEAISQGVYLKSLKTHEELMFLSYNSLGVFMESAPRVAIRCFNKAIKSNPTYVDSYCNRANAKRKLKDFKGAFADIRKAVELDHHLVGNYRVLSFIYQDLGRSHKAEECIEAAFDLALEDVELAGLHNHMGNIRRKRGDFKRAIESYSKAIELNPNCDGYSQNIAAAKEEAEDIALADYEEVELSK